jgi:hypothetical protein
VTDANVGKFAREDMHAKHDLERRLKLIRKRRIVVKNQKKQIKI